MRVAWIVYDSLDRKTGGTLYDARIVEFLRLAGDDVDVLAIQPGRAFKTSVHLAGTIARLRPDVVVADELCFRELASLFPRLSVGRRPIPLILLVHHLTAWELEVPRTERLSAWVVERIALRTARRIVTTSLATRDRLAREALGRPHPRIDVVVPGADRLDRYANQERPSTQERPSNDVTTVQFVFLGAIIARKRVVELLSAFAAATEGRARTNEVTLSLIGNRRRDPDYVRKVDRTIAEHHLDDRVRSLGEASDDTVARALSEADALVMPSSLEGWGIAATEAIHAGTPVIAARTSGLVEALTPADRAVMFVDGFDELRSALERFARERGLRAAMKHAAEEASARMPTWASAGASFRDLLLRDVHDAT